MEKTKLSILNSNFGLPTIVIGVEKYEVPKEITNHSANYFANSSDHQGYHKVNTP